MQDFAAQLRGAAAGIDPDVLAERAAALREGREAGERHQAQGEAARERELTREQKTEREADRIAERDRGLGHGL